MELGKLLFLGLFYGILTKDSGQVRWKNRNINRKIVSYGYLPEERGLYPKDTVLEQLTYFATLKGMKFSEADKIIRNWCDILDVTRILRHYY